MRRPCQFLPASLLGLVLMAGTAMAEPLVIAHRGASGYLPEHTLAAKALAVGMGADYIEQDVVLTKDGVPIVLHDITLDATTDVAEVFAGRARADGLHYAIDFTLEDIRRLQVLERAGRTGGLAFPGRFPRVKMGLTVPTLEEEIIFLKGLAQTSGWVLGIYPELKSPAFHRDEGQDLASAVIAVLAAHDLAGADAKVYLQSFDFNEIRRVRQELGYKGKLVQLLGENSWNMAPGTDYDWLKTPEGLAAIAEVADGIGPSLTQVLTDENKDGVAEVTPLVRDAKAFGLAVHPYTLRADRLPPFAPDFGELVRLTVTEAGADGFFTDQPDLGLKALGR